MKSQPNPTQNSSNFNHPVKVVFRKTFIIISLGIACAISGCDQSSTESKNHIATSKPSQNNEYQEYLSKVAEDTTKLSSYQKELRLKALNDLKVNETYIALVNNQVVKPKYLIALQAIGECLVNLKQSDDTYSIPITEEKRLQQIPGALQFVVRTVGLQSLGGITEDILNIYSRYLKTYPITGFKGTTTYKATANETFEIDYSLSAALAIFKPRNEETLNAYYEAIQEGIFQWQGDDTEGDGYKYSYLRNKYIFNYYLRSINPHNKHYIDYSLLITAKQLYADYDANEVAADDKYKDKTIAIKGHVSKIAKDILGTPYITLSAGYSGEIQCSFDNANKLKKLSKGDYVTVIGKCNGKMAFIVGISNSKLF